LYSFKTRVNEPIQGALAMSPQAKAEWSAELTSRRLQEAEELAATGGLTPVAMADIETGLNAAVERFDTNVTLLAKEDDMRAASAQSDLEATLNAHEVVLSSLPTTQKKNASQITSIVRKHAASINQARVASEAVIMATDTPQIKTAALRQQRDAEDAIDNAKLLATSGIDTDVASSVAAITDEASTDVHNGTNDAKRGNWGKAYSAFQDALRKVKETKDSVNTRNWLKRRFGVGLDMSATSTATSTDEMSTSTDSEESNNLDE
jgi:hypothetical protein